MAADILDTFTPINNISQEKKSRPFSLPTTVHLHTTPGQQMLARYESDEEQTSESDMANRDDQFFSDSDLGTGDSDVNMGDSSGGEPHSSFESERGGFTFTMPVPQQHDLETLQHPTSKYTVKRISGLTLLPPVQSPKTQHIPTPDDRSTIRPNRSRSPSLTRFSMKRVSIASSILIEAEFQSFYSDTVSSDEENGIESHFFLATPVVYHLPKSRPNLIFISRAPARSEIGRASKKHKKQKSSPLARPESSSGNTKSSTTMKSRLSRLRLSSRIEDRRMSETSTSVYSHDMRSPGMLSNASTPLFKNPNWGHDNLPTTECPTYLSPRAPEPNVDHRPKSMNSNPFRKRQPRASVIENNWNDARQPQSPINLNPSPEPLNYRHSAQSLHRRVTDFRKGALEPTLTLNDAGRASCSPPPSSPSQYSCSSINSPPPTAPDSMRFYGQAPGSYSSFHTDSRTGNLLSNDNYPQHYPYQPPEPPRSNFQPRGDRTRSMSSMASNGSKFSLPVFDASSLKNMAQGYRHRSQKSGNLAMPSSSLRRPSTCSTMSEFQPTSTATSNTNRRGSRLRTLGSISTTNLNMLFSAGTPTNSPTVTYDEPRADNGDPLSSNRKKGHVGGLKPGTQPHSRSKSFKWGESVSQAGSKAFSGIGSMLKKKTTSSPTVPNYPMNMNGY
ncbi:hypothetical protein FQN57_000660 [Myotisia sp. PD_48]|nr:hypothetical protein FQN57_000660 [Myotisia sp. PD_48]